MRKTIAAVATAIALTSAPALAADLPMKARPLPPSPAWSWSGFYVGVHAGAGWGTDETNLTGINLGPLAIALAPGLAFNQNSRSGFLGGGQAGFNWQSGLFVLGVQGDIAGMDVKGRDNCLIILNCTSKSDWLATVSGRVGAVVLDRGLVYVKGGGAWMHTNNSVDVTGFAIPGVAAGGIVIPATNITSAGFDQGGWLLGMGTEWMITPNLTAFVEYDYMRFEDKNVRFALTALPIVTFDTKQTNTLSVAKVGVNYKFGWGGPVVAKY
jgi:outer membrane immunogenic protein